MCNLCASLIVRILVVGLILGAPAPLPQLIALRRRNFRELDDSF